MWPMIMSIIGGLIPLGTQIGKIWESSGGFAQIAQVIAGSPALKYIEDFAAQQFPAVDAKLRQVLGAIHLWYPPATKWVQQSLNALQTSGIIKFGDPLVEDGVFGNKTFAAVVVLQDRMGLKITGGVADAEYKIINTLLDHIKNA